MDLHWDILAGYGPLFVSGLWMTLALTVVSIAAGLLIGVLLGLVSSSRDAPEACIAPESVLAALRADPAAGSYDAVAMATSAEVPAELRKTLLDAGFDCVIEKPCQIASLSYALGATLGVRGDAAVLDDEEALRAAGDLSTVQALRELFRDELRQFLKDLEWLSNDPRQLIERLHRLRSACGFCGAGRLAAQAKGLQSHLMETQWVSPSALCCFRWELESTLAALA